MDLFSLMEYWCCICETCKFM